MHSIRRLLAITVAVLALMSVASASAEPLEPLEINPGIMNIEVVAGATAVRFDVAAWVRDAETGVDPDTDPALLLAKFTTPGVLINPPIELCTDHPDDNTGRYSCNDEVNVTDAVAVMAEVQAFGYRMTVDANSAPAQYVRNGHSALEPLGLSAPGPGMPDDPKYDDLDVTPQTSNVQAATTPPKFKPSMRVRDANGQNLGNVRVRFYTKSWSFLCEGVSNNTGQVNECITPNFPGSGYANISTGQSVSLLLPLVGGYNAVIARECRPAIPPDLAAVCYQHYQVSAGVQSI
jgi:hypothetical protein